MAALIAASSSADGSDEAGCKRETAADIRVIAMTSVVKNTKTVPMPASISVKPWSINVSCMPCLCLERTADYTQTIASCLRFDK